MIDLGLARISRLLQQTPPPAWKAIHVAGTNGKGSVCAYLSAMLHARGLASARFTSPHLVDRWDCVVVDERVVAEPAFRAAEQAVAARDRAGPIGATEFELLAATAFEVFGARLAASELAGDGLAVVECGLGGGLDATTAMRAQRAVTVVTRIGLDHTALLGGSLAAIAAHKAGIMQPGVPCVVDPANREDRAVRDVLEAHARAVGAPLVYPAPLLAAGDSESSESSESSAALARLGLEPHQLANLACACAAFQIATADSSPPGHSAPPADRPVDMAFLASVVQALRWPGRLQRLDVGPLLGQLPGSSSTPAVVPALLDGAHNAQSADVLGAYVDKHLRTGGRDTSRAVSWVLAASRGKDLDEILRPLLRAGDRVAAVTFGPVDGMPWVRPAAPRAILARAAALGVDAVGAQHGDRSAGSEGSEGSGPVAHDPEGLVQALQWAVDGRGGPLVIAGSLYLVSDTLRRLRQAGGAPGLPA